MTSDEERAATVSYMRHHAKVHRDASVASLKAWFCEERIAQDASLKGEDRSGHSVRSISAAVNHDTQANLLAEFADAIEHGLQHQPPTTTGVA